MIGKENSGSLQARKGSGHMALQLIEAYIPRKHLKQVDEKLRSFPLTSHWMSNESADRALVRMLAKTEDTEEVLNYLESVAHVTDGFEVILLPVQSYIQREVVEKDESDKQDEDKRMLERASRQELFMHIEGTSKTDMTYVLFVLLSAIVVTIGLAKNNPAVIIGGMVIAPLLGPVIGLAFGSILGDYSLVRRAIGTVACGIGLSLLISILFGLLQQAQMNTDEFELRTQVDLADMGVALASGAAGALSVMRRVPGSLVGVMVAVALLPPTVVAGMSLGTLRLADAGGASLLLLVNISSILLSAVIVFRLAGIRPVKYEEVQRARNSRKFALLFITVIVLLLLFAVLYSNHVQSPFWS